MADNNFVCAAVLGGTSKMALSIISHIPSLERVILIGRVEDKLRLAGAELKKRNARLEVDVIADENMSAISVGLLAKKVMRPADGKWRPDLLLMAQGFLVNDQHPAPTSIDACMDVNFVYPASFLEETIKFISDEGEKAKPVHAAVIGSVAGDRARPSNRIYGCAKAAINQYVPTLSALAAQKNLPFSATLIKPGLTATPMIAGRIDRRLVSSPDAVGKAAARAVMKRKRSVYVPSFWGILAFFLKHAPWFVFKRIKM